MKQPSVSQDEESRRRHYINNRHHHDNHDSPNHFCFRRDEIGNLTYNCIVDRLKVMTEKECTIYNYDRFVNTSPHHGPEDRMRRVNPQWRAQIAKWSYNVADNFCFSRECVAVSMNLFDLYFAHEEHEASKNKDAILLVSCATLSIAIKQIEVDSLSLKELSRFSRGKFSPTQIFHMEWKVANDLDFYLNPPTVISFAMHLLLLLPHEVNERDKNELVECTRFVVELSVADSYFVGNKPSIIAAAAIMISLQQCTVSQSTLSTIIEIHYWDKLLEWIGIDAADSKLKQSQHRLQTLLKSNNHK